MDKDSVTQRHMTILIEKQTKHGVIDGSIHSVAWDKECTSYAGIVGDLFIQTNGKSANNFALMDGHPTPATSIAQLEQKIKEPERTVNMISALANQSLLSGVKFVEARYVSVCDGEEVNIYDGYTTKITVSEKAFLSGWRCPSISAKVLADLPFF